MKKYLFFVIIFTFLFYGTVNAAYYTWEDETGATHITNYPPPQIKSDKNVKVHQYESDMSSENIEAVEAAKAKEKDIKKPDVVLYTKNECADCDKARDFLKSRKIIFTEYNTEKNKEAAVKRKEIDKSDDVPFAIINRNHVYGFSETIYNRALKTTP